MFNDSGPKPGPTSAESRKHPLRYRRMRIGGVKQSIHVAMGKLILLVRYTRCRLKVPAKRGVEDDRLSIVCALAPAVEMATGKGTISRRGSTIASGRWTLHEIGRASDLGPCHTEKCCRRVASFARPPLPKGRHGSMHAAPVL
jgi:hypothetical protein